MSEDLTYNPFLPEVHEDPYPTYRALREADPVHRSAFLGVWLLTRHDDVDLVLRDRRFSAVRGRWKDMPELDEGYRPSMLSLDPPDHTRLRVLVSRAFTPRVVERVRPWARGLIDEVLDRAAERGGLELMEQLAYPLPVTVINRLLGLPGAEWQRFREWAHAVASSTDPLTLLDPAGKAAFRTAEEELMDRLAAVVAERRRAPRDDLVSALVAVSEQGETLDEPELLIMLELLLVAGYETTGTMLGNAVRALLRHPDQLALLHERPELIAGAVEELVRWDASVQITARVALVDCELRGRPIRRGELLVAIMGAANRDPGLYPDPERLDITRAPRQHFAFGRGVHFCLGAPLARLELQLAIGELVRRFPGLRLAGEQVRRGTITIRGFDALPLAVR